MISLLKTQEYAAVVRGTSQTVKVLHKDVAVQYFQSIDPAVTKDQVIPVKNGTSAMRVPVEYMAESLPTSTRIYSNINASGSDMPGKEQ